MQKDVASSLNFKLLLEKHKSKEETKDRIKQMREID